MLIVAWMASSSELVARLDARAKLVATVRCVSSWRGSCCQQRR